MCTVFFIHLCINGHSSCWKMWILLQCYESANISLVLNLNLFGKIARNEMTQSRGRSVFNFFLLKDFGLFSTVAISLFHQGRKYFQFLHSSADNCFYWRFCFVYRLKWPNQHKWDNDISFDFALSSWFVMLNMLLYTTGCLYTLCWEMCA